MTSAAVARGEAPGPGQRPPDPLALAVIMAGMFVVILDTTIVNVALPAIGADLGVRTGLEWVVTGYFLAMALAQAVTGWFAGRVGLKWGLILPLAAFGVMACVAAVAPNLTSLVVARAVQGAFGGLVIPIAGAAVYEIVPKARRGAIVGLSGAIVALGPAAAPLLGGYLVTATHWRWLLFVGAPTGLACAAAGVRYLPVSSVQERRPFDVVGLFLGGGAVVAFLLGLSQGGEWGWSSPATLVCLLGAPVLLGVFVARSRVIEHPLVRPAIFRLPAYLASLGIVWAVAAGQFGSVVFVPVQLQVIRGMTPLEAGAIVAVTAVVAAVGMPFVGRWTDRSGGRVPVIAGAAVVAVSCWRLGTLEIDTPVWHLLVALGALGLGRVLITMPAAVEGFNVVADRLPDPYVTEAASMRALNRQLAGAVVTAGLAAIVASRVGSLDPTHLGPDRLAEAQSAYNMIFLVAIGGAVIIAFLARYFPGTGTGHETAAETPPEVP